MVVKSEQVSRTSSTMPTYMKQINLLAKKTLLSIWLGSLGVELTQFSLIKVLE